MEFAEIFEDLVLKTRKIQEDIEDNDYEQQLLNEQIRISNIAYQDTNDLVVKDYLESTIEKARFDLNELKLENDELQNEFKYYSKIVSTLQAVYQRR